MDIKPFLAAAVVLLFSQPANADWLQDDLGNMNSTLGSFENYLDSTRTAPSSSFNSDLTSVLNRKIGNLEGLTNGVINNTDGRGGGVTDLVRYTPASCLQLSSIADRASYLQSIYAQAGYTQTANSLARTQSWAFGQLYLGCNY